MTRYPKQCLVILMLAAAALLAGLSAASRGGAKCRRLAANAAAERSFSREIAMLASYTAAESRLSEYAGNPGEVPLRPALPLPDESSVAKTDSPEWIAFSYSLSWRRLPSRTALELLEELLNLDGAWRVSGFSLDALDDGESASFRAEVVTARRAESFKDR